MPTNQIEAIKQMYGSMKIAFRVKVDGQIKKTNALFIDAGSKDTITLLEMDFGKLLESPAAATRLASLGDQQDMNEAKKKLKGFPGLKIETSPRVEITF